MSLLEPILPRTDERLVKWGRLYGAAPALAIAFWRNCIAAGVLSGGLALFLYEVSPEGGKELGATSRWLVIGPIAVGLVIACMGAGAATSGPPRSAATRRSLEWGQVGTFHP